MFWYAPPVPDQQADSPTNHTPKSAAEESQVLQHSKQLLSPLDPHGLLAHVTPRASVSDGRGRHHGRGKRSRRAQRADVTWPK